MNSLFTGRAAAEVVPAAAVRQLTGTTAADFRLEDQENPEVVLDEMIEAWIEETASNIRVRLGRQVDAEGIEGPGMRGVLIRTVANVIAVAMQQRSSPIIQLGDFATNVLNTSDALAKLDDELQPFLEYDPADDDGDGGGRSRIDIFWSSQEYEGA